MVANDYRGIAGKQAPPFQTSHWIDGQGQSAHYELTDFLGNYVLVLFFQSTCPACHSSAFPGFRRLYQRFHYRENVQFLAIQTVRNYPELNQFENLIDFQRLYELPIPMGHHLELNKMGKSCILDKYNIDETPWMLLIHPNGTVLLNNYFLSPRQVEPLLK